VGLLAAELYKTLIVGPPNAGKSSLVRRYQSDEFRDTYGATIAADMSVMQFDFPEGKVVLTVVDIGGQETFAGLRNRFYSGAHHLILVYDATSRESFEKIAPLYEALTEKICIQRDQFLGGSLVANKTDLVDNIAVPEEEGKLLANLLTLEFFSTSAKTGKNVAELFHFAAAESRRLHGRS
jgi:small GTP-binding protein